MPTRSVRFSRFVVVLAVVGLILVDRGGSSTRADDAESGFVPIFDGRTLDGWHKNPQRIGHGTGGHWFVEDGAITGEQDPPGSGNGGILLTDKQYGNFELRIDLKPDWGVCSGLFLRSTDKGQCLQMMVDYHGAGMSDTSTAKEPARSPIGPSTSSASTATTC